MCCCSNVIKNDTVSSLLVYDIQTHFIENQLKEQHSDTYKSIEHNAQTVYNGLLVNNTTSGK